MKQNLLKKLLGIVILFLSIYISHILFFTGPGQNGSGRLSLIVSLLGCGAGLALMTYNKSIKKNYYLIPLVGTLIIFMLSWFYHINFRNSVLESNSKIIPAVVTYKGGINKGEGIKYSYTVEGVLYEKEATNSRYIEEIGVNLNDTILVRYWPLNPNYHDYSK